MIRNELSATSRRRGIPGKGVFGHKNIHVRPGFQGAQGGQNVSVLWQPGFNLQPKTRYQGYREVRQMRQALFEGFPGEINRKLLLRGESSPVSIFLFVTMKINAILRATIFLDIRDLPGPADPQLLHGIPWYIPVSK